MTKSTAHTISVKLRFDIPITPQQAVREFRDCIHGEFYPGGYSDAETMKIVTAKTQRLTP